MSDEKRCTAGQQNEPTDCERHPHHYWCKWCEGWYGVPHDDHCHTAKVRQGNYVRYFQRQCACRFCTTADKLGTEFTYLVMKGVKP